MAAYKAPAGPGRRAGAWLPERMQPAAQPWCSSQGGAQRAWHGACAGWLAEQARKAAADEAPNQEPRARSLLAGYQGEAV